MPSCAPLVSINIPCYHQLAAARRCVEAMLAQTLDDIEITLIDDGASEEYRGMVESIGDARVSYQRNPVRLGAMRNMFQSITAGHGKYTLAFHEDDLLGPHYLASAVAILEGDPRCGFVGGELHEFEAPPPAEVLERRPDHPAVERFSTPADFLRMICRGIEPMFGSIVYRRAAVEGLPVAHDAFATLVDRPFLMSILNGWSGAILRDPLVWYGRHGDGDIRHLAMNTDHILRLFAAYRAVLPARLSHDDRALFYSYSGYWLFTLYCLTPPAERTSLRRFVGRAWRAGLYNPRWSAGYGRKRLVRLMLTGR
jgi:cellulose synthase/poly-beta-1,6-N-acetylglucosamine synthase-like glycosyltransferase